MLLYLGFTTNQRSVHFWISSLSVGSESSGPFSVFFGVFVAEEVDKIREKGSGCTMVEVQMLL